MTDIGSEAKPASTSGSTTTGMVSADTSSNNAGASNAASATGGAPQAGTDPRSITDRYNHAPPPPHSYYGARSSSAVPPGPQYHPSMYGGGPPPPHGHMYGSGGPPPPPHAPHSYHHPSQYMPYPPPNGYADPHGGPPPPGFYSSLRPGGQQQHHHPQHASSLPYGGPYGPYDAPPPGYGGPRHHPGGGPPPPPPTGSYPNRRPTTAAASASDGTAKGDGGTGMPSNTSTAGSTDKNGTTSSDPAHDGDAARAPSKSPESATTHAASNMTNTNFAAHGRPLHAAAPQLPSGRPSKPSDANSRRASHPTTITISVKPEDDDQQQQQKGKNGTNDGFQLADPNEVDRLRAAAATELTPDEVKPIVTDFHFFARDYQEQYRKLAEEEVLESARKDKGDPNLPLHLVDPILINTNLNTRLMRAWENLSPDEREVYMGKEEADRRRFMEEDEIASRHCATLTARGKSPKPTGGENGSKVRPTPSPSPSPSTSSTANNPTIPVARTGATRERHADEKKEEHPFEEKKEDDMVINDASIETTKSVGNEGEPSSQNKRMSPSPTMNDNSNNDDGKVQGEGNPEPKRMKLEGY